MLGGNEKGLCCEPRCQNRKRKDRRRCYKCSNRRWRKANPMKSAFNQLRDHAGERGIPFRLSFPAFVRFALQSDYLNRKGPYGHCLTVDRINNTKGYTKRNVQALTREQNSIKKARRDAIRIKVGNQWKEREAA